MKHSTITLLANLVAITNSRAMFSFLNTSSIYLYSFVILITLITLKWTSFRSKTKQNLPPSPSKLPIIGNLHQLGSSPHRSLKTLADSHGPLMIMHFGSVPVLVASSANVAKEIMKTHDLTFSNRPKLRIADILVYGSNDITFSQYGEYWRQVKSMAVVHLLNSARVQTFREMREKEVGLMIEKMEKKCGNDYNSVIDVSEMVFGLINDIVCKVALGRSYYGLHFLDLLARFVHVLGVICVGNYIPWLAWVDRVSGLVGKARKVAKELDEFFESVVEEHEHRRRGVEGQSVGDKDLVDVLLD